MHIAQTPALLLGLNILLYWATVVVLVVRVGRKTRGVRGLVVPAQTRERVMGLIWTPVVLAWIVLPFIASGMAVGSPNALALPSYAGWPSILVARWLATAVALGCWMASIWCWRHMGRNWRIAVDPDQPPVLLTDGPFAYVRHPIYAISILMMVSSVVVVPTWPMAAVAGIHLGLMNLKARNEEAFLQTLHGPAYQDYCRKTGRFFPRRLAR
jgi:protein-S-isoprenylcysteine O-methyltransferase Ste14